jgi:hypothetical protein
MKEPSDKSAEVKAAAGKLEVKLNDICDYFEQDTGRLFSARECWYCKHADFGINTEHPKKTGKCNYKQ